MFDAKFHDFLDRHKAAIRDPTNERKWLFESGAIYIEAGGRGEPLAYEPSPNPAERLTVQLKYVDAVYRSTWRDFTRAESTHDLDRMQTLATKLKSLKERSDELNREWNELPEMKEQRAQEQDRAERQRFVQLVIEERDREIREQVHAVGNAVREALPIPPSDVKVDVFNRLPP